MRNLTSSREDNAWACANMAFLFERSTRYLISLKQLNKGRDISCLQATMYYFVYCIDILITMFCHYLKISDHFPKILEFSKSCRKAARMSPNIFRNFRRLPKTFTEDPKMFRSYTNKFKQS